MRIGYSSSNLVIKGNKPFESLFSPTGGMTVDFPINKKFLCQSGLLYFHKGYSYNQTYSASPATPASSHRLSTNLNYLALPVLAGYNLKNKIHCFIGPQVGYLLTARYPYYYYRKFDFSAVASAEYKLFKNFGIYTGYNYGVSKITKGVVVDNTGTVTGFEYIGSNRTLFLGIFYEGAVSGNKKN